MAKSRSVMAAAVCGALLLFAYLVVGRRGAHELDSSDWTAADHAVLKELDRVSGGRRKPRDFYEVITSPVYIAATERPGSMVDDEVVIGLKIEDEVRAYPVNLLNYREMVEDVVAGIPILVTW